MKIISKRGRKKADSFWALDQHDFISTKTKLKLFGIDPKFMDDEPKIYKIKRYPERQVFYIDTGTSVSEGTKRYLEEVQDSFKVGYKAKKDQPMDAGYFYCPYIPLMSLPETIKQKRKEIATAGVKFHDYTTHLQDTLDPQFSLVWERGERHRLGWSGNGDSNG